MIRIPDNIPPDLLERLISAYEREVACLEAETRKDVPQEKPRRVSQERRAELRVQAVRRLRSQGVKV